MTHRSAGLFSSLTTKPFPVPQLLSFAAAGIDISDRSIKFLTLAESGNGYVVEQYGEVELPQGAVVRGVIEEKTALIDALIALRQQMHVAYAHAALPEEAGYVFSMKVPHDTPRDQIIKMIEFEFEGRVPIPPSAAVYDYDLIPSHQADGMEIAVVVFPRDIAERYIEVFKESGITLLSLELEARSIARAVSPRSSNESLQLIVDCGRARTGFAVVKSGIPIFTSTVEVGGDAITRAVSESLSLNPEETERFKNDQGLLASDGPKSAGVQALTGPASALADEIARHYHYWDTRRNDRGERMSPVREVVLVGGSSNLRGLTDYIAARVQAPTVRGKVWGSVCSFDEYVPPIDERTSLQYATAIGLALRST